MRSKKNNLIAYVILIVVGAAMIYPLFWLFFATFKDNKELFGKMTLLPEHFSFRHTEKAGREADNFPI